MKNNITCNCDGLLCHAMRNVNYTIFRIQKSRACAKKKNQGLTISKGPKK